METLSLLKNSKNSGIYSDLFDKNEKEYKKEIKDYEDLRYKVERIVSEKSIPIFDEIRKNEIENIKNDINKEKIIINVRDFHKLEGMLGYKHERSRHLSLIEQGKESFIVKAKDYLDNDVDTDLMTYSISGALNELALRYISAEYDQILCITITHMIDGFRKKT